MELKRPSRQRALISLVPMVDVMLILLVFFMVTSSYLNLDMLPASQRDRAAEGSATPETTPGQGAVPVLVRLGADNRAYVRGVPLDMAGLSALVADRDPANVMILPSARATTETLIQVLETATLAGAASVRIVRLEARQ